MMAVTHGMIRLSFGLTELFEQVIVNLHSLFVQVAKRDELGRRSSRDGIGVELNHEHTSFAKTRQSGWER